MWPFKNRHKHTWEEIDKRVFQESFTHIKTGHRTMVEGVATLHRCSSCGAEKAYREPNEREWWLGWTRDYFGEIDPFLYRHKYNINNGGK